MFSFFWRNEDLKKIINEVDEIEDENEVNKINKMNKNAKIINNEEIEENSDSEDENFDFISLSENKNDYLQKLKLNFSSINNKNYLSLSEQNFSKKIFPNLITEPHPTTPSLINTSDKEFYFQQLHAKKLIKNEFEKPKIDINRIYLHSFNKWASLGILSISKEKVISFEPSNLLAFEGDYPHEYENKEEKEMIKKRNSENDPKYYLQRKLKRGIKFDVENDFLESENFRESNDDLVLIFFFLFMYLILLNNSFNLQIYFYSLFKYFYYLFFFNFSK